MTTYDDRLAFVREEIANCIPDDVQAALAAASFAPVLDAGNLWFYDAHDFRLCFGEDGSDYPDSLDYPCSLMKLPDPAFDDTWDEIDHGPLREVLERFTGKPVTGLPAVGQWLVVRDFLGNYPIPSLPAGTRVEVMEHVTEGVAYLSVCPAYGQPGVTDQMFDAMTEWDGCWYVYTPDDGRSLASEVWARLRRVDQRAS